MKDKVTSMFNFRKNKFLKKKKYKKTSNCYFSYTIIALVFSLNWWL